MFIALTAVCTPLMWYLFPETKGLSLEEIGEKFGDEVVVHLTEITDEQLAQLDEITSAAKGTVPQNDSPVKEKTSAGTFEVV